MAASLNLSSPFLLAPMAGFTTAGVRRLFLENGAGGASTGLVDAEGLLRGSPGSQRRANREEAPGPQLLQLFANDPAVLEGAAALARGLGFQGVELNLGCPATPLLARGCGGALLGRREEVRALLAALRHGAGDLPAGVKTRSGRLPGDGEFQVVHALAAEAGLDWFSLHPRSLAGGYEEPVDWSLVDTLPGGGPRLWAGGGLGDADEARAVLAAHPCLEAVLIGRAALTTPWIFRQCRDGAPPPLEERAGLLADLLRAQVTDLDWQEARRLTPGWLAQLGLPHGEEEVFRLADRRRRGEWMERLLERLQAGAPAPIHGNPFLR
jgi:tRNA-dihydrouridine synthase B